MFVCDTLLYHETTSAGIFYENFRRASLRSDHWGRKTQGIIKCKAALFSYRRENDNRGTDKAAGTGNPLPWHAYCISNGKQTEVEKW
jgi:hypothetical protein